MPPRPPIRSRRLALLLPGLLLPSLLLPALPALADPAPARLRPARDVAVLYRVQGGNQGPQQVPAAWLAAQQRLRLEPPGLPGWIL
ncbi:hypothetical protein, partial [Teichococcus cervicalis]